MASISSNYSTVSAYTPAQAVATNSGQSATQTAVTTSEALTVPAAGPQSDNYSSQAYQMTLGNASAAQQNMQTLQTQNHLIEQMNAGFGGSEI